MFRAAKKFEGKYESLKGHIFECRHAKHGNKFLKTRRELIEYIRVTFEKGDNTARTLDLERETSIPRPVRPINPDETDLEIWFQQCK